MNLKHNKDSKDFLEKTFCYELIIRRTYKMQCFAISITTDNSFIALAQENHINIFQFKKDIHELQQIQIQTNKVTTLNFFSRRRMIVSGSLDSTICISSLNILSNRKYVIKLKGHSRAIQCLVITSNKEDLIISGSRDATIKFWKLNSQLNWFCYQSIHDHNDEVYGLSINDEGNKLLSCGKDQQILIMIRDYENKWQVIQKIKESKNGYRLCFINNNLFAFQPDFTFTIHLYFFDPITQEYVRSSNISTQTQGRVCYRYFPLVFLTSKNILISKFCSTINLISFNFTSQSINWKLIQTIEFSHHGLFGTISKNGEFLITWDQKQKEFQIRKYQEN
ncbi:unnamed protein product [Paramecium sonneborni]|uniref:Uncharacterized protein n=1 Tax=Paramecium sonneborni TaxID=65129 RepID=A0A8S1PRM3_9CILI|nr:unnamed protein product [Paramecium sonneborni]